MYLNYNIDQIHQLLNEFKKRIVSYKRIRETVLDTIQIFKYKINLNFIIRKYKINLESV
jgi:hypothetical protein